MKTQLTLKYIKDILLYEIPKFQRIVDDEHVEHLVNDQKEEFKKWGCFSILQSISVAHLNDKNAESHYIIDGQHRLLAFKELNRQGYPVMTIALPVVVYEVDDLSEMKKYFARVNTNKQIHPLELHEDFANVGKVIIENMTREFGVYIKNDGKNSRCPHINLVDLKKHIAARDIGDTLKSYNLTINTFWNKILQFNSHVLQNIKPNQQLCQIMKKRLVDCQAKANKQNSCTACYLGVWRKFEWLDFCLMSLKDNILFEDMNIACDVNQKRFIPFKLREQVWKKENENTSDVGICFTCGNYLNFRDMECGHIKAHSLGGTDTFDNLMPICKSCNKDMGIMDLLSYKHMIGSTV